jgi:hypothetical protein
LGQVLSAISEHEFTFAKLRRLSLSQVQCSSDVLAGFIGIFRDTLQDLSLIGVILDLESWKDPFTFFANELSLVKLYLRFLDEEDICRVSFRPIHLERPVIDEAWFLRLRLYSSDEGMEFFSDFQYVTREISNTTLILTDGAGEDIRVWLTMLSGMHELVDIPDQNQYDIIY